MLPKEIIHKLRQEPIDVQRIGVLIYLNNEHPQGRLLHILEHKELTARLGIRKFLETIDNAIHQTDIGVDAAFFNGNVQEYRVPPGAIAQYKRDDVMSELPSFLEEISPYFKTASKIEDISKDFIPDLTDMERVDLNSLKNRVNEIEAQLCEISIAVPHLIDLYYEEAINELT